MQGLSKCFWIANLQYLVEIKNPALYNLVSNSLCFSQAPDGSNESIQYSHSCAFVHILNWSIQVVDYKINGRSFYFGDGAASGSVSDLFTVVEYLKILLRQFKTNEMYADYGGQMIYRLHGAVMSLSQYLSVSSASELLLAHCVNHLDQLVKQIDQKDLISTNQKSFYEYAVSL